MKVTCKCGVEFITYNSRIKVGKGKYCSLKCKRENMTRRSGLTYNIKTINKGWFKKGQKPWNYDIAEELQPTWKGDKVGYDALHEWVEKWRGKPRECQQCGSTQEKVYQWSNISGKYLRRLDDWQRLCVKCHCRYDFETFGARKVFYS